MPEIIFNGPEGRLEGRYHHNNTPGAPIALVLHPHPQYGGTMNNKVVFEMFQTFKDRGYSVLRFNFRGVGRSQGEYDAGIGELIDAASALDWLQSQNKNARACWIGGFSFGAWIGMQLLMRRPEIDRWVSVSPPSNMYDFSFLAPCPSNGLIIQGNADTVVPQEEVDKLAEKLEQQKGIDVTYEILDGASHFYEQHLKLVGEVLGDYVDENLPSPIDI